MPPLRDGERDQRGPAGGVVGGDAPVLRGEGGGRRAPHGERARLHDRAPRRAHRRPRARGGDGRHRASSAATSRATTSPRCSSRCSRRPASIGKTFELVSGDTPVEEAVARPVNEERAEEVLRRARSVPEGRVTTYGDLCPGAPRFAGTVLSELPRPGRALAAHRARRRLARLRASASAACSTRRACPSAASAWTCARPGCRSELAPGRCWTIRTSQCSCARPGSGCSRRSAWRRACPTLPITIRSASLSSATVDERVRGAALRRVLLDLDVLVAARAHALARRTESALKLEPAY